MATNVIGNKQSLLFICNVRQFWVHMLLWSEKDGRLQVSEIWESRSIRGLVTGKLFSASCSSARKVPYNVMCPYSLRAVMYPNVSAWMKILLLLNRCNQIDSLAGPYFCDKGASEVCHRTNNEILHFESDLESLI